MIPQVDLFCILEETEDVVKLFRNILTFRTIFSHSRSEQFWQQNTMTEHIKFLTVALLVTWDTK